jgi:DNA-binding HxlR family transcriptional regulator
MERIPTNLLADRLRRLEDAGLIARATYRSNPPRYEYTLTPKGEALRPVLQELVNWGRKHLPDTKVMAEHTGNPADSPFLPAGIKLPRRRVT